MEIVLMPASKYSEAVRQLLESELRCPHCGAENVAGKSGKHIEVQPDGLAVCNSCLGDWRPELPR
jgi:transcription elongation factor Elf1